MTNPPDHVDVAQAVRRVAEYVRQRDIAMSGGNVGDAITTIHTDPGVGPAHLDVNDLRVLVIANDNLHRLHRAVDTDGRGPTCVHCTALADCDVRWPCRTVRALGGER